MPQAEFIIMVQPSLFTKAKKTLVEMVIGTYIESTKCQNKFDARFSMYVPSKSNMMSPYYRVQMRPTLS